MHTTCKSNDNQLSRFSLIEEIMPQFKEKFDFKQINIIPQFQNTDLEHEAS